MTKDDYELTCQLAARVANSIMLLDGHHSRYKYLPEHLKEPLKKLIEVSDELIEIMLRNIHVSNQD